MKSRDLVVDLVEYYNMEAGEFIYKDPAKGYLHNDNMRLFVCRFPASLVDRGRCFPK